jgi:hypothetical protein
MLGHAAADGDNQGAQADADLHAQCTPAGVHGVIKVRRKKNMAVVYSNLINTFELQGDILREVTIVILGCANLSDIPRFSLSNRYI